MNSDEGGDFGDGVFFCAEGIVARRDDPEKLARVQCVIPMIDENEIHEVWARRLQIYTGDSGFSDYFVPALGSAVALFGRLGGTDNFFYAPVLNEINKPPTELSADVQGVRVPFDLRLIAGQMAKIQAQNIEAIAAQVAKILAQNVEIGAEQLNKISGSQIQLNGSTITIGGDGSITITGGSIQITGTSIKLFNRTVNPTGPPI